MNAVKEAPDYLHDEHLSQGTKTYLNVLNGGGPAVESLPVPDARRVLADLQAAVPVDLSGEGVVVDGPGGTEGGDEGGTGPGKDRGFHKISFPVTDDKKAPGGSVNLS